MLTSKNSVLCILRTLEKYSDENNILNATQIQEIVKREYGLTLERKSIYRNISFLCEFGYDISIFEDNKKGFYLIERPFENSEIDLLIDAVASSKFIHTSATKDLIKKLENFKSPSRKKTFGDAEIIKANTKTINKNVFLNIEEIREAIKNNRKIAFNYCEYNLQKELVPRPYGKCVINPYGIVCTNENYYLICNNDKYEDISNYRIDYIIDIEILEDKIKAKPIDMNLEEYAQKSIYMFSGKTEKVELICENKILKDVIDKFGGSVALKAYNDDSFKAILDVNVDGIEFWVLQYINFCEVIEPIYLRERIKEYLVDNLKKYQ